MKKKMSLSCILILFMIHFLSACGKEEGQPAEEETWLKKLEQLAVESVIENSEMNGSMVESGNLEVVIDKIYSGSFSNEAPHQNEVSLHQENGNEIFLDCRLLHMPHMGGLDTRSGILLNADTMELIAYKDFIGDEVLLSCLQTEKGQSRILCLHTAVGQGHRTSYFDLWTVQGGEWVEIPTGIEELIPEEKRGDWGTEDCFLYMGAGDRLVVTYEEDEQIMSEKIMYEGGSKVPSELTAILVWSPRQERFELATDIEQPDIQKK